MTYCKVTSKLLIIYAIQSICGGIAFYISLFLKNHTTLDALLISFVISATSIGNILGSYIGGYVADKYNPAYGLKTGLGIQGVALLCLVFTNNVYGIFFIMALMGAGSYLYITSSNYVLNSKFNTSEQNRVSIISNQHIISNVGMFLSAILMGYCAAGYYLPIFISMAFLMLIIAIKLQPFEKGYYCITQQDKRTDRPIQSRSAYYFIGLLAVVLIGVMYSQLKIGYPVFLDANFGTVDTGYLMALNPLIILLFQGVIIKQSTKLHEIFSLGIGLLLLGCAFLILTYPINMGMVFLSCGMMTVGEILSITYAQSIAFAYAPAHKRGRAVGLYKSIYSFTAIMGSYIAGGLINYSSYQVLWGFCGTIGLFGFLATLVVMLYTHSSVRCPSS